MQLLALLHSIIAIPLIYMYTAVLATISLTISFFDPDGRKQHRCAHLWCRLIAATAGMRVRTTGIEHLPAPGTPVVYMANHQSYMDIPVLFGFLPVQFRIIAKESLFKVPFMGWHLTRAGNIPINRTNRREAMRSISKAAERIREGTSVVVFPEGTRSRDGHLQEFKAGSFKLGVSAGVPIVPLTIIGTCRILEKDSLLFHPGKVELHIHPAIPTAGLLSAEIEGLMDAVWTEMAEPLVPLGLATRGAELIPAEIRWKRFMIDPSTGDAAQVGLVHCPSCGHDALPSGYGPEPTLCVDCQQMFGVSPGVSAKPKASGENPNWGIPESAMLWLASYFAMLASAVIAIVGFVFVAGWLGTTVPAGEDIMRHPPALIAGVLSSAVGHLITLLLAWIVVTDGGRQPFLDSIGWGWGNGITFRHVMATFGIVYGVTIAVGLLVREPDTPFKEMLETSYGVRVAVGLVAVLTAPLAEEVVYRGVLYPALARRFGVVIGVVVVSALFLLVHAEQYASAPAIMLPLAVLSVALTTLRAMSGSIMPSVLLHVLFNGFQVALLLLVPDAPPTPEP